MLRIVKRSEPLSVRNLALVIYGAPGVGKTTLACTSDRPLLIDFENGAPRAAIRADTIQVEKWSDVVDLSAEDLSDYGTVVIDTLSAAQMCLATHLLSTNPRLRNSGSSLSLPGWGELKTSFTAFLSQLRSFGKDLVVVAHMEEEKSGDDLRQKIAGMGGSTDEVHRFSDAICRFSVQGNRFLDFTPDDVRTGKDPAGLGRIRVPNAKDAKFSGFLHRVMEDIRGAMRRNAGIASEQEIALSDFGAEVRHAEDVDAINGLIARAQELGDAAKQLLHSRARGLGLVFRPEAKGYVHPDVVVPVPGHGSPV